MQGVIKAYDPSTGDGVVMCDTDLADYDLAANALEGSIFRMLRQGQRVVFDLDESGRVVNLANRLDEATAEEEALLHGHAPDGEVAVLEAQGRDDRRRK